MSDFHDPKERLGHQLAMSAKRHAHAAMRLLTESDTAGFYLHAGAALEHAIKARLCRHNPVYLAPKSAEWFGPATRLLRKSAIAVGEEVKTVGAVDALHRLQQLETDLSPVFRQNVIAVLNVRDHVAHVGMAGRLPDQDHQANCAAFVRAINVLLQQPVHAFWAQEFRALAESLESDDSNRVGFRVGTKLAAAKVRLEGRTQEHYQSLYVQAAASVAAEVDPEHVALDCPVCAAPALASGTLVDEGDAEFDKDGDPYWVPALFNVVEAFRCAVCQLELDGQEEAEAAGLEKMLANPNAHPSDVVHGEW